MIQILISLSGNPSKLLTLSKTKYIREISKSGINSEEVKSSSDLKIDYSLDPKTLLNTQSSMNWETYKILAIDEKYIFPCLSFSVFNLHT